MTDADPKTKLIVLLHGIDFGRRYYAFCDEHKGKSPDRAIARADYEQALAATGLSFSFDAREKFFGHRETAGELKLTLNVLIGHGDLELVLAIESPRGKTGGTFHGLAYQVQLLDQPEFQHSPKYPRIPFHSSQELQAAAQFAVGLYQQARALIIEERW